MDIAQRLIDFRKISSNFLDADIPNEKREPLDIVRFIYSLRQEAVKGSYFAADMNNIAFLLEKLHEKLADARLETLVQLATPLVPELNDWLTVQKKQLINVGVRAEIDKNLVVVARLCNHAGGGCDCESHPTK